MADLDSLNRKSYGGSSFPLSHFAGRLPGFAPTVFMVFPYAGLNFMYFSALKFFPFSDLDAPRPTDVSTTRTVIAA